MDAKRSAYKPLRNVARRFSLTPALADIWAIQGHVATGRPLPPGFDPLPGPRQGVPLAHFFPQFKIDLAARELLLHGVAVRRGDRTLRKQSHLADLFNAIRKYGDETTARTGSVMPMLHRIGHQQVPGHASIHRLLNRSLMVYGHPGMRDVFAEQLGLSISQYLRVSLSLLQDAMSAPYWRRRHAPVGVPDAAADALLMRMSATVEEHRALLERDQVLDVGWEFTPHSLHARPLVRWDASGATFCCPIVPHLVQRVFSGVYYDLVNNKNFSEPFGEAVDNLIGLALRRGYPVCVMSKPAPYQVGRDLCHGADWIATDLTANVFIECKAKRPRLATKTLLHEEDIDDDIDTLARAIAQNYQNIDHAQRGLTAWVPNGLPTFSIVATLEDWVLFSPFAQKQLHDKVMQHLSRKGLRHELIELFPYFVASSADIEELACASAQSGFGPVMLAKRSAEHAMWMFGPFLETFYPDASRCAEKLFENDVRQVLIDSGEAV